MTLALNPRRLVQPAHEPVSLAEVKLFLRIEHDVEDSLLATLISAAREAAEALLDLSCIIQTWQWDVPGAPCAAFTLPRAPVVAILQVQTREREDADWTVLAPSHYQLRGNRVQFAANLPMIAEIRITYEAGLSNDAAGVPAAIRHALLQHSATLYESRGSSAVTDVQHIYAGLREVRL